MPLPTSSRPHFPEGYLANPKGFVAWERVEACLTESRNYWLCSVRPDGRPHVIPKWGVWVEETFYFDGSTETRHAKNIARNPRVAVHLESGDDVVILEGICKAVSRPSRELGEELAKAYVAKYASLGYAPQPDQWDGGGLFQVTPTMVLAWTQFTEDPTRFTFESAPS